MGSTWCLREKMLLMPMSLGAGRVSARLIVPRGVLVFPLFYGEFCVGQDKGAVLCGF